MGRSGEQRYAPASPLTHSTALHTHSTLTLLTFLHSFPLHGHGRHTVLPLLQFILLFTPWSRHTRPDLHSTCQDSHRTPQRENLRGESSLWGGECGTQPGLRNLRLVQPQTQRYQSGELLTRSITNNI